MNREDLEKVNKEFSYISNMISKIVDVLSDKNLSDKDARDEALEQLDNLSYEIPTFVEIKKNG